MTDQEVFNKAKMQAEQILKIKEYDGSVTVLDYDGQKKDNMYVVIDILLDNDWPVEDIEKVESLFYQAGWIFDDIMEKHGSAQISYIPPVEQ